MTATTSTASSPTSGSSRASRTRRLPCQPRLGPNPAISSSSAPTGFSAATPATWAPIGRCSATSRRELLWTDPPYGVDYEGKTEAKLRIANDGKDGLPDLLGEAFAAADAALPDGSPLYIAHPGGERSFDFGHAFLEAGWSLRQTLVWVKDSIVLGHLDYHYRHEQILYGFKPGKGRLGRGGPGWHGDDAQASVLEFERPEGLARAPDDEAAGADRALPAELIATRRAGPRSLRWLGLDSRRLRGKRPSGAADRARPPLLRRDLRSLSSDSAASEPEEARLMARPSKLTAEVTERIVAAVRAGNYPSRRPARPGISPATYYRWMKRRRESQSRASNASSMRRSAAPKPKPRSKSSPGCARRCPRTGAPGCSSSSAATPSAGDAARPSNTPAPMARR